MTASSKGEPVRRVEYIDPRTFAFMEAFARIMRRKHPGRDFVPAFRNPDTGEVTHVRPRTDSGDN